MLYSKWTPRQLQIYSQLCEIEREVEDMFEEVAFLKHTQDVDVLLTINMPNINLEQE